MKYGFIRAACVSPEIRLADCAYNADIIVKYAEKAADDGVSIAVFPELCITGYTCGDLFLQQTLLRATMNALVSIANRTARLPLVFAVGLPAAYGNSVYNCAAVIYNGQILALVPKTHIPNYGEFYEARHFSPAASCRAETLWISDRFPAVPFGTNVLITDRRNPDISLALEICEDLWAPLSPSVHHALAGAIIIFNLSASNETAGKKEYRKLLTAAQSGKLCCAYLYADTGKGESTTDLVFAAHNIIAENGTILSESAPYGDGYIISEIDTERLIQERRRLTPFASEKNIEYRRIVIDFPENSSSERCGTLRRFIDPHPFVPSDISCRKNRCREITAMQSRGLAERLSHIGAKSVVIGLSGGLDSTLALLAAAQAFKIMGLPTQNIIAATMPCFGTTDRTYRNACLLAEKLGAALREIPIQTAVRQHFADIGHDESVHDAAYENSQARERTQILMDLANQCGALVVGTGDLSELALGWATYNGDHMSMYGVNSSIPKTLVRYLVEWFAEEAAAAGTDDGRVLADVLRDILATPVSPELLPPEHGTISQKTESLVGPYELHDFFLYYTVRWGFSPEKVLFLAEQAFLGTHSENTYTAAIIKEWLAVFYRRFFSQQFKRSCMPDGAKVGTVSLSPRGDWRMPSDASVSAWLKNLADTQ
ncbi:MAG: NAD(+) synthase [Bacteroides sp.]|nr:NAD(+) synthase [Prevotella sp.]MCM1407707.1 NAD(+) synthase [Treponema brennaborense]MCM1469143.1 NAD(+) synthase [Bacteroides sp.]